MYLKFNLSILLCLISVIVADVHQEPGAQRVVGDEEQAELIRKWDFEVYVTFELSHELETDGYYSGDFLAFQHLLTYNTLNALSIPMICMILPFLEYHSTPRSVTDLVSLGPEIEYLQLELHHLSQILNHFSFGWKFKLRCAFKSRFFLLL